MSVCIAFGHLEFEAVYFPGCLSVSGSRFVLGNFPLGSLPTKAIKVLLPEDDCTMWYSATVWVHLMMDSGVATSLHTVSEHRDKKKRKKVVSFFYYSFGITIFHNGQVRLPWVRLLTRIPNIKISDL